MAGRESKEIVLYARLGFLVYADGYVAQVKGMKPGKDQQGNDVWDFALDPSDELVKRYDLKPNRDGNMMFFASYPYDLVIPLNLDPTWTRYFYLRTYDGMETPAVQVLKGNSQQQVIMELKQRLRASQANEEVAREKLQLMEHNLPKYMKRNVTPFLEELAPLIKDIGGKDVKKDG